MVTTNCKINYLWNNGTQQDWQNELDKYYNVVKPSNVAVEQELDNLDVELVKNMTVNEFYNFLHDKYFVWKYTDSRWFKTTISNLEKYLIEDNMFELEEIHHLMFKYNPENIGNCLRNAQRIRGLGIAGASGLLSLLFPKYFGTVDQFVVKSLLSIEGLTEHETLKAINPDSIKLKEGVLLVEIMKNKAVELNKIFNTDTWTPRKIDKILWSIDR